MNPWLRFIFRCSVCDYLLDIDSQKTLKSKTSTKSIDTLDHHYEIAVMPCPNCTKIKNDIQSRLDNLIGEVKANAKGK